MSTVVYVRVAKPYKVYGVYACEKEAKRAAREHRAGEPSAVEAFTIMGDTRIKSIQFPAQCSVCGSDLEYEICSVFSAYHEDNVLSMKVQPCRLCMDAAIQEALTATADIPTELPAIRATACPDCGSYGMHAPNCPGADISAEERKI